MKTKLLNIVVILLMCTGCATTPDDLRRNDAQKNVFVVNFPYGNVYDRLNKQMAKCFQWHAHGATSIVQNHINPDSREATVILVALNYCSDHKRGY